MRRNHNSAIPVYIISAAAQLFKMFLTERINPRKESKPGKYLLRRAWSHPHQGKQECARRVRQMARGIIQGPSNATQI